MHTYPTYLCISKQFSNYIASDNVLVRVLEHVLEYVQDSEQIPEVDPSQTQCIGLVPSWEMLSMN